MTGSATRTRYRVEGLDCRACAIKVENGLKRLADISDINMNCTTEMLSVRLDQNRTSRKEVEGKNRALGYAPRSLDGAVSGPTYTTPDEEPEAGDQSWWKAHKSRTVLGLGGLLALAFAKERDW